MKEEKEAKTDEEIKKFKEDRKRKEKESKKKKKLSDNHKFCNIDSEAYQALVRENPQIRTGVMKRGKATND